MKPRGKKKYKNIRSINPTEEQIQKAFVKWARMTNLPKRYGDGKVGDYLFHAPSEGKRTKSFGKRLKDMGWCEGFPDIAIFLPFCMNGAAIFGYKHALFIEFKSVKGKQTKEQKDWEKRLTYNNFSYIIVKTLEEAIRATKEYLSLYIVNYTGGNHGTATNSPINI